MKLLSVSTLMVMMPVRQVAVTMGLNTEEEESPPLPKVMPSFRASAVPTDAVVFGFSELELEIVGALSAASEGLCAVANCKEK